MAEASGSGQVVIAGGAFAGLSAAADTPGNAGPRLGPCTRASRLVAPGRRLELAPSSGRHDVLPAMRGAVIAQGRPSGTIER
jgi:hypothetical protein